MRTKFFGYMFFAEGVFPDPDKVTALRSASPPTSKEDVRSFLGMAGLNSKFIPGYATLFTASSVNAEGSQFQVGEGGERILPCYHAGYIGQYAAGLL